MNTNQKIVLWIGVSLLLVLLVYPPYELYRGTERQLSLGHRCIISPAIYRQQEDYTIELGLAKLGRIRLDFARLSLEIILIVMITVGGLWAVKEKKNNGR